MSKDFEVIDTAFEVGTRERSVNTEEEALRSSKAGDRFRCVEPTRKNVYFMHQQGCVMVCCVTYSVDPDRSG